MKLQKLLAASLLAIMTTSTFAAWRSANSGAIPPNAWRGGYDTNNQPLYLCRGNYQGSVTPGKIAPGFTGCNITYAGHEYTLPSYHVFTTNHAEHGHWRWVRNNLPMRAWQVGRDTDGKMLYLCRARYQNSMQLGKTWAGLNGCDIGYAGREYTQRDYQVFILR